LPGSCASDVSVSAVVYAQPAGASFAGRPFLFSFLPPCPLPPLSGSFSRRPFLAHWRLPFPTQTTRVFPSSVLPDLISPRDKDVSCWLAFPPLWSDLLYLPPPAERLRLLSDPLAYARLSFFFSHRCCVFEVSTSSPVRMPSLVSFLGRRPSSLSGEYLRRAMVFFNILSF